MGLFDFDSMFGDNSSGLVGGALEGLFGSMTPAPVEPRNLYDEALNTLATYTLLSPTVYGLESTYRPKYAQMERGILTDAVRGLTSEASGVDPQQARLLGEMNSQALSELKMGAQLDPSLAREVQQSVRAGQSARGLGLGPADVYQEAMQIGSAGQAMRNQRRAYAGQVAGMNLENVRPYLALSAQLSKAGPQMIDMWNPYASDLYNTNYNAESARNIAAAANRAAITGATINAAGQIGASILDIF